MRKIMMTAAAGASALIGSIAPTQAQSFGYGGGPPAPIWAGFYVGGHIGYSFNDATVKAVDLSISQSGSDNSGAGGIHGGYNFQTGPWVYGLEADWTADFAGESTDLFTIRGRLGYAFDRMLVYATAGWGTESHDLPDFTSGTTFSRDFSGFVIGGGVEAALDQHFSIRAEALYFSPSTEKYDGGTLSGTPVGILAVDVDRTILRGGITYHFN